MDRWKRVPAGQRGYQFRIPSVLYGKDEVRRLCRSCREVPEEVWLGQQKRRLASFDRSTSGRSPSIRGTSCSVPRQFRSLLERIHPASTAFRHAASRLSSVETPVARALARATCSQLDRTPVSACFRGLANHFSALIISPIRHDDPFSIVWAALHRTLTGPSCFPACRPN